MSYLSIIEKLRIPDYFRSKHTQSGAVEIDSSLCTGCNICASICPARALEMVERNDGGKKKIPEMKVLFKDRDVKACLACGDCLAACPSDAITITRGYNSRYFFRKVAQTPDFAYPKKY